MRPLVLDASAGVAIVLGEAAADEARQRIRSRAPNVIVPSFFWLELTNVLRRRAAWRGEAILNAVYELEELGITTISDKRARLLSVIDVVERHALSAYDADYLALALETDADLLTADRRLAIAAGDRAVLLAPDAGIAEERAAYRESPATWGKWSGAGAYLAELRSQPGIGSGSRSEGKSS